MDRRVWFFSGGSVIAAILATVSLDEIRLVPICVSAVYAVLALGVYLDSRSRGLH